MTFGRSAGTMIAAGLIFVLSLGRPVLAQHVGDRVRVTVAGQTASGPVTETSARTFKVLVPGGWEWEIGHGEVERLEVSTGTRRTIWKGLGFGVGAGLVVSAARVMTKRKFTCNDDNGRNVGAMMWCWGALQHFRPPPSNAEIVTTSTAVLGVAGTLLGALVKRDVWAVIAGKDPVGSTLDPVFDTGLGSDGNPAVVLGARIRF